MKPSIAAANSAGWSSWMKWVVRAAHRPAEVLGSRVESGVRGDDAAKAPRMVGQQAQPEHPAPVMAHHRDVAQIEAVEHRFAQPVDARVSPAATRT
jgi:hypothetical protein